LLTVLCNDARLYDESKYQISKKCVTPKDVLGKWGISLKVWRGNIMYVLKLKGDLVWQTAGPDKSEDPLEFELEALLSKRPTPLLVYGEVHRRIKKTLNVDQLDAFTFAELLEEFAAEIRKAAESYE
jgi:hypothetical protein